MTSEHIEKRTIIDADEVMSQSTISKDLYTKILVKALTASEIAKDKRLELIEAVATSLWGKDLRDAYQISRSICLPIFIFLDQYFGDLEKFTFNREIRWTLLEDSPPPKYGHYLTYCGEVEVLAFSNGLFDSTKSGNPVTHWAVIPPIPKGAIDE